MRVFDLENKSFESFEGNKGNINSVAFSFDGQYIGSGGDDKIIRIFNINSK